MLFLSKKAFTLVELLIVVVILTILATIGFISYEDYLVDARDSKRIAHLTGLRDAMRLTSTKKSLPLPDASIEIRNNGIGFLYQGYAGKTVLESVGFSETTQDPFDEVFYTYLVSENKKDFQLLGFLEKYNPDLLISSVSQSYAVNYTNRVINTVGKKLGVLVQQISNTPLQELLPYTASGYIDLATDTSGKKFDAYVTDTYVISGTGSALTGIIPFITCKKILENGDSRGDGIYGINPSGYNPIEAYCDMTIDGGGWTLVARSTLGDSGNFGWNVTRDSELRNNAVSYSLGPIFRTMNFKEVMLTTYVTGKNIEKAIKANVTQEFLQSGNEGTPPPYATGSTAPLFPTSNCTILRGSGATTCFFSRIGYIAYTEGFIFNNNNVTDYRWRFTGLLSSGKYDGASGTASAAIGDFLDKPGMIFVR